MLEVGNNSKRNGHGLHLIILCDEIGIFDAFYFIKDNLTDSGAAFLSLIYYISDKNHQPLFEQELCILEKRYSTHLIVHILRIDKTKYCFKQELIEATINSNTLPIMKFSVFGNVEFVNDVSKVLRFLDVMELLIDSKIT